MKKIVLALVMSAVLVPAFATESAAQALQQGQGKVLQHQKEAGNLGNGLQATADKCKGSANVNCKGAYKGHRQAIHTDRQEQAQS